MMQFNNFLNLRDCVLPEIVDESRSYTDKEVSLKVVGQEQNHEILLVWDDDLPFSSPKKLVTFVGSYQPSPKKFVKLFTFESQLNIIRCSLSPDRCIIAYTTYSTANDNQGIYAAYLAEIHNRVRTCIYSLNLQHVNLVHVQFLWPQRGFTEGDPITKESRLLVLLHNKLIGLYTLNLRRTGIGMVLDNLPVAQQICGSFIWAQWDKLNQRLYLVVPRSKHGKTKNIFRCLEFSPGGSIPTNPVLMMELPFLLKGHHHVEQNSYDHDALSPTVSGKSLNMQVITQTQGLFCICYQHVTQKQRQITKTTSTPSLATPSSSKDQGTIHSSPQPFELTPTSPLVTPGPTRNAVSWPTIPNDVQKELWTMSDEGKLVSDVDVTYSIYCVHNATLISATIHKVPREKAKGMKLYFGPLDGYIFVYSPGIVQDVVNITAEFRPCHHIALHPAAGLHSDTDQSNVKLGYLSHEMTSHSGGTCMYDVHHQIAYQYSWSKATLCQSLRPCLAKPLLHYAIIQARDNHLREEIMTHLTQDPTDPDLMQYFLEFIVASTYAVVRKQIDDFDIFRCLPFTTETEQQQLLQTRDGERIATFVISHCKSKVDINTETGKRIQNISVGNPYLFSRLNSRIERIRETDSTDSQRYSAELLKTKIKEIKGQSMPNSTPSTTASQEYSVTPQSSTLKWAAESVKKLTRSGKKKRRRTPSPVADGQSPVLPVKTEEEWLASRIQESHIDAVHSHLQKHLTYASSEKLVQIATMYCKCQQQQIDHLINILIRASGLNDKSSPSLWDISLSLRASNEEYHLFQLMERLLVAMEIHCLQVPKDFAIHFTCLGFRCLDFPSFVQYVEHDVFQLNKKFLSKMIADLSDDVRINRAMKLKLIFMLPESNAMTEVLRAWDHPEGNAVLTKLCLETLWTSETSKDYTTDQPVSPPTQTNFPPLTSLLRYTQDLGKLSTLSADKDIRLSSSQITAAALYNSIQKCGEDLSGFTF